MAAKKKTSSTTSKKREPKPVPSSPREHRSIDARELRDDVKNRKQVNGVN